ncbi:MAG: hypothetical protein K2V38_04970, partial [Gemmataceae bacterium]|nr:hypothetical protein [Gemmataceae bacterium]
RYLGTKTNPDGSPSQVPVWSVAVADGVLKLTRTADVPVGQAEEYYGLKYARWALEAKPDYEPAQALVLSLAAERATDRAKGGHLAVAEPNVYRLLTDAPSKALNDLLARGLNEKRTPLVLAMVQVLGDRADRDAATPPAGAGNKPSLLVRALSYPDHAVQFGAAAALLRGPVPVPPSAKPLVVDILRRAAATDPGKRGESPGTVLLADPAGYRSDANAALLRGMGFEVEQYASGRDLLRRVNKASDFDLIVVDRHTPNPELIDLVANLSSDPRAAGRPVVVIASADKAKAPTFDQLLLRTSMLIAATENDVIAMPEPYVPDPRSTAGEQIKDRAATAARRDATFRDAAALRRKRLQSVIDALPLTLNDDQKRLMDLRIAFITYGILAVEFPLTPESSPDTVQELARLRKQLALQPAAGYSTDAAGKTLMTLIDRFEIDVAKAKGAQQRYDFFRSRVDPTDLGIVVETFRDPVAEAKLARQLGGYPAVKIIPEPYSRFALESDLKGVLADPNVIPRSAAAKKEDARTALDFIRLMATGDLPGYDLKSVEGELRDVVLTHPDPDLVSVAIDALERFKSGAAQQALLQRATRTIGSDPVALRRKAADAAIRHVRAHGKAATPEVVALVVDQSRPDATPDADLRAKFLTLKGMLAFNPGAFADQLKGYNPPLVPPAPEPKKEPEKKEPEKM